MKSTYILQLFHARSSTLNIFAASLQRFIFYPSARMTRGYCRPLRRLSVCPSVRPSVHPCERDNSTRNILISFKLHTDVPGVKISDEFGLDLSATSLTLPIESRSTFLVNAITPQQMSEVFLGSKSRTSSILTFL